MTPHVGIRELRDNLSRYVEKVKRGQELVVTERGVPVARLVPDDWQSVRARLIAEGILTPAKSPRRRRLPPPIKVEGSVTDLLIEQRRSAPH